MFPTTVTSSTRQLPDPGSDQSGNCKLYRRLRLLSGEKEELTEKYAPAAAQAVTEAKQASDNKLSWQQQKEEQARQRKRENELKK